MMDSKDLGILITEEISIGRLSGDQIIKEIPNKGSKILVNVSDEGKEENWWKDKQQP